MMKKDTHPPTGTVEIAHGIFVTVHRILGDRIMLRELSDDELTTQTEGGLWLPDQAQDHQRLLQGEIVAVGEDCEDPTLVPGLRVICNRWSRVPIDQTGNLWMASEDALQAIITMEAE
jgi:co-chaperonin GroES (HSP10)